MESSDIPLSYSKKMGMTDFAKPIPGFTSFLEECVKPTVSLIGNSQKERQIIDLLMEKVSKQRSISYIDAFEMFYETISEMFDKPVVGGKTTYCYAFKNQMLACIPNLKWIDIVRDIRGAMLSGIVTGHRNFNSINSDCHWENQVETIKNYPSSLRNDRHLVIKYEDLVVNKKETINDIVDFLGIDHFSYDEWESKPILKNNGSLFGTHSSFDEAGKAVIDGIHYRAGKDFDTTPVKRWERKFSSSEKWFLTGLYKKQLIFLGYPVQRYFPINFKLILNFGIKKIYLFIAKLKQSIIKL